MPSDTALALSASYIKYIVDGISSNSFINFIPMVTFVVLKFAKYFLYCHVLILILFFLGYQLLI